LPVKLLPLFRNIFRSPEICKYFTGKSVAQQLYFWEYGTNHLNSNFKLYYNFKLKFDVQIQNQIQLTCTGIQLLRDTFAGKIFSDFRRPKNISEK